MAISSRVSQTTWLVQRRGRTCWPSLKCLASVVLGRWYNGWVLSDVCGACWGASSQSNVAFQWCRGCARAMGGSHASGQGRWRVVP